jgi:hypothetical protein
MFRSIGLSIKRIVGRDRRDSQMRKGWCFWVLEHGGRIRGRIRRHLVLSVPVWIHIMFVPMDTPHVISSLNLMKCLLEHQRLYRYSMVIKCYFS